MIGRFLSMALLFFGLGLAVAAILCGFELFSGTGLSHPIWDPGYNWLNLLRQVSLVSIAGAALKESVAFLERRGFYDGRTYGLSTN